ncbi:hypothetical protein GN155_004500 [Alcanivorax sp. ZXX171]|nr:hypothetical protein [Alcanivorax sp. ZXX171]
MRSIGQAQRTLEIMASRVDNRVAFGQKLSSQSSIRQDIAKSFSGTEQARLLTLKAASYTDKYGNVAARDLIAPSRLTMAWAWTTPRSPTS